MEDISKFSLSKGDELRKVLAKVRDGQQSLLHPTLIELLAYLGYLSSANGCSQLTLKSYRLLRTRRRCFLSWRCF